MYANDRRPNDRRSATNLPKRIAVALLWCAAAGAVGLAFAHGNATGIVKERMESMKHMGDAGKAIAAMIKGETDYSAAEVAAHARTINDHSRDIIGYFPENSLQQASEALPAIWQRWEEFERLAQRLQASSETLIETSQGGDPQAVRAQFARVGKTCKGCHKDFRQKKNK